MNNRRKTSINKYNRWYDATRKEREIKGVHNFIDHSCQDKYPFVNSENYKFEGIKIGKIIR